MSPPAEHPREIEPDEQKTEAFRQNVIFGMFVAMMIGMTLFEKIGVGPADAPVALIVPITFAALGAGILFAKPLIRFERMLLYFAVVVTSALSNVLFANTFSVTSLLLYFVLYLPLLVAFDTTEATYRRCLSFFSTAMLVFGAAVWAQHAIQFSIGWRYWPNLDKLVPPAYLIPQFVYMQPIRYGMDFMKPQGFVFLEVSFVSQFLAFALIIELLFLQRMWRAAFFAATLFATFAGTGMLLVLAALPIIFTRTNTRTFVIILITAVIALFVAFQLHWFDLVADRLNEFQRAGSSGSSRFIDPLDRIRRALADPTAIYSGVGAGQIERAMNIFWWPIVKATVEYGLIQGILFYVFFIVSLFDRAPSRQLSMILILWFSFEGTLLTPLNPLMCVMLSTMFVLRDQRSTRRNGRPRDAAALA
ncbi:hypothetical protein K7957_14445 [Sphingomonas yunnanensis]|uniref:hypothetical protein n=1 Tax=Sphingomonas yunnanensis TaxID=310400 RepID=UPI001CA78BBA|nr:hypothetical protein [Sphingomonas yunnanensis]MBY9064138.1 hypothetical protein [Sphingomonas yunnanensis]